MSDIQKTPAQQIATDWRRLVDTLSYRGIVKSIPFLAYIALLCVVYISSNARDVEVQRELEKQQQVLKELTWAYKDTKTRLMAASTEARIINDAAALGLKPLMLPAYEVQNLK